MPVLFARALLVLTCLLTSLQTNAIESMSDERRDWLVLHGVLAENEQPKYINALIYEDSPYLLSHALQPINWVAWTEGVLAQAKQDKRLIYLSIGYETCHWCHVLAEESYVDESIAGVLNQHFVNIKVDRERRPQLDQTYRRALENMTGSPGWPIQVVLTPSGKIVWIDSYTPRAKLHKVLSVLSKKWQQAPTSIENLAKLQHEQLLPKILSSKLTISDTQYKAKYTEVLKGKRLVLNKEQQGEGPRFLRANWLLDLLDEYSLTGDTDDLSLVTTQVKQLLSSPVYDFVDGGMHRYAEDGDWRRPHYEKMLYDQAQLIRVLVRLSTVTSQKQYLTFAKQTISFVESKLRLDIGLYASSLSALSDGVEGAYYDFSDDTLSKSTAWRANSISGATVLSLNTLALPSTAVLDTLQNIRRIKTLPRRDTKAVLSWNALYLLSLTELYQIDPQTTLLSKIESLRSNMTRYWAEGQLQRIIFQEKTSITAEPEDYAWLFLALSEVHWTLPGFLHGDNISAVKTGLLEASAGVDWSDFHQDSELASSASMVLKALHQIVNYSSSIEIRETRVVREQIISHFDVLSLQLNSSNLLLNWRQDDSRSTYFIKPFARGHGVVRVNDYSTKGLVLELELEKGWHINSNSPLRDTLIKTEVTVKDRVLKGVYPEPVFKYLGFDKQALSLYEGVVYLPITLESKPMTHDIKLRVQACSDSLCLTPEDIIIKPYKSLN